MKKLIPFLLVVTFIFLTACVEKKTGSSGNLNSSNYLTYNLGKLPNNLLMLDNDKVREKDLLLATFEGLIRTDENGKIVPAIAESWTIDKDEITYTFKLRKDASWSNGTKITAKDFVTFFSDVLNPKYENIYASDLYYIFGAKDYRENKKQFNTVAVRALDDSNLEIRLNSPCSYFLNILCKPVFTLRSLDETSKELAKYYKDINFTGPFKIEDINGNGSLLLVKNNNYWNKEEVKSEKILITSIEGSENSLAAYRNSKINIFVDPPISEASRLSEDGELLSFPLDSGSSIAFNLKNKEVTKNLSFRKAISSIISREIIVGADLNNTARPALNYIQTDEKVEDEKKLFNLSGDLEKAKELLKDSKFDKKEGIRLVYLNDLENKRICETIAADIKKFLDVRVETKGYDEEELKTVIDKGEYEIIKTDFTERYGDSISILENYLSTSKENIYGYKNAEYDNLINKAKIEKDKTKKKELIMQGEGILYSDLPSVPIYFNNIVICRNSNIEGLYVTIEGNIKLDKVYKYNNKENSVL